MKNYRTILFFATTLGMISASVAQAGTLTVINKIPDQYVYVLISGEGSNTYYREEVEAGAEKTFVIQQDNVKGKPTFKVTASTSSQGDPDWKFMGGTCANLVTDANHTIIIDSTAGKLSCTNATADNPPAHSQ